MTVAYVLPIDLEEELGEVAGDLATFQKLRRNRDGQMPVGRDRARHRSSRRNEPWHARRESLLRRSDK